MVISTVLAHEGEEVVAALQPTLDQVIRTNSIIYSIIALGIILAVIVISFLPKSRSEIVNTILFGLISVTVLLNTAYLVGATIYLNQQSETGGPVHWHADFRIFNCGQELELADPMGFSSKIGSETIHEHNDRKMHIEGVLLDKDDASLGHFFESVGGDIDNNHLTIPTNHGLMDLRNGDKCPNGQEGKLQVFVYTTKGDTFYQQKLVDPKDYIISPEGNSPPGDCIIFDYDYVQKTKTEKICQSYKMAIEKGELYGN